MSFPDFVVKHLFHKYVTKDGQVIYWRDCALAESMKEGEQGYVWVYEDSEYHHSYWSPEQAFGAETNAVLGDEK